MLLSYTSSKAGSFHSVAEKICFLTEGRCKGDTPKTPFNPAKIPDKHTIDQYGIPSSVVNRLRLQNTMEYARKVGFNIISNYNAKLNCIFRADETLCTLWRMFSFTLQVCPSLPPVRKPTLNKDNLKKYRPVSNISFLSKILEKVVANH